MRCTFTYISINLNFMNLRFFLFNLIYFSVGIWNFVSLLFLYFSCISNTKSHFLVTSKYHTCCILFPVYTDLGLVSTENSNFKIKPFELIHFRLPITVLDFFWCRNTMLVEKNPETHVSYNFIINYFAIILKSRHRQKRVNYWHCIASYFLLFK